MLALLFSENTEVKIMLKMTNYAKIYASTVYQGLHPVPDPVRLGLIWVALAEFRES